MRKKFFILGIVLCAVSVFLLYFGYQSMKDTEYADAIKNYDYYESQMEETSSMAKTYGNSGVFGGTYSKLASGWYDLLKDARKTIITVRIKIGIGFGGGIVCIILGIILIITGLKRIRKK